MPKNKTYTAIEQSGYAIFGVGETLEEALADANQWLDTELTAADLGDGRVIGEMCEITISASVRDAVLADGGDVAIEEFDGVYYTPAELDAADNNE
jgi:hypothetical protein